MVIHVLTSTFIQMSLKFGATKYVHARSISFNIPSLPSSINNSRHHWPLPQKGTNHLSMPRLAPRPSPFSVSQQQGSFFLGFFGLLGAICMSLTAVCDRAASRPATPPCLSSGSLAGCSALPALQPSAITGSSPDCLETPCTFLSGAPQAPGNHRSSGKLSPKLFHSRSAFCSAGAAGACRPASSELNFFFSFTGFFFFLLFFLWLHCSGADKRRSCVGTDR